MRHRDSVSGMMPREIALCARTGQAAGRRALVRFIVPIDKKVHYVNVGPRNGAARSPDANYASKFELDRVCRMQKSRASVMICDIKRAGNLFFSFPIMAGFVFHVDSHFPFLETLNVNTGH